MLDKTVLSAKADHTMHFNYKIVTYARKGFRIGTGY